MKSYFFTTTRTFLLILRAWISILISFIIIYFLSKTKLIDKTILSALFIVLFILIYIFTNFISIVKVSIKLDNDLIEIIRKSFFSREFKESFKLSDIKNYLYENVNSYEKFSLTFKKSKLIFLVELNVKNISKFNEFYVDFEKKILKHNNINPQNKIDKSLTIYQSKLGYFYAVIIGLILIITPLFYILKGKFNLPVLLILYPSGLLYIYKVYLERRK